MKRAVLVVVVGLLAYGVRYYLLLLPILTGYGAKYMCSSIFLAQRGADQLRKEDLGFSPVHHVTFVVNQTDSSVTGSFFGLAASKAIYRDGLGATLVNELSEEQVRAQTFLTVTTTSNISEDDPPWPMSDRPIDQKRLQQAIDALFVEKDPANLIRTRAVVIVHDGKLLAERYATGFSSQSRFLGWSMTKSLINALVGILVHDGRLNIDQRAPVPEWNNTNDPRHAITTKHLLQQTSGLDFVEDYYATSDVTRMLFRTADMAAYAASRPLKHAPGTHCYYTSGSTNLLSRIVRHTTGEREYHSFPYRKLFDKLGMQSMVMEVDASGTFVGSSYSWATARDWARFGLLYLNNGVHNHERILPERWVEQTTTLSGSNQYGQYGLHFWLNTGRENDASTRRYSDAPTDMFYASGFDGQAVFVIPSRKLVIVRLGLTKNPQGEYGANRFLNEVISSIE